MVRITEVVSGVLWIVGARVQMPTCVKGGRLDVHSKYCRGDYQCVFLALRFWSLVFVLSSVCCASQPLLSLGYSFVERNLCHTLQGFYARIFLGKDFCIEIT